MIRLEHEMIYRVQVAGPLPSTAGSPLGEIEFWQMADAWLEGPRIAARAAMPGGDWMRVGADGYWRPDVRIQLTTSEGATVLMHYSGLVKPNEAFRRAAAAGDETKFEDQYLRQVLRFETGDLRVRWLTQELFIAEGRLAGKGLIEYNVYRLA